MNQLKLGALAVCALLLGAVAIGGIASTRASEPSEADKAKRAFWNGLGTGDIEAVNAARDQLIAAFASYPDDGKLPQLIGAAYSLSVSEIGWLEPSIDPAEIPTYLEAAYDYTKLGAEIPVDDEREYYKRIGFHATPTYILGTVLGDETLKQESRDLMEVTILGIPDYGYAVKAQSLRDALPGSADYAAAVETAFLFFEHCTGETFDREYPDLTPVLSIRSDTGNPTCGNSSPAPHGLEGWLFTFADMLVKNGQPDAARPVYELVPQSDGYDTWASHYHDLVDERLASDLAARAALYQSDDVSQHPDLGLDCLGCHRR